MAPAMKAEEWKADIKAQYHPHCFMEGAHPDCFMEDGHPDCFMEGGHPDRFMEGGHPDCFMEGGHPDRQAVGLKHIQRGFRQLQESSFFFPTIPRPQHWVEDEVRRKNDISLKKNYRISCRFKIFVVYLHP